MRALTQEPSEVIAELVERYNDHDLEGVVDLYAEDARIRSEATYEGRDEIRDHFRDLWTRFGDAARLDEVQVHVTGGIVLLECVHRGQGAGGQPFGLPMAMVFRVEEGLIREDRSYVSPGEFATLLQPSPPTVSGGGR